MRLFDAQRAACSVEYEYEGAGRTVAATREVVLCAGALETPKLLLRIALPTPSELENHERGERSLQS